MLERRQITKYPNRRLYDKLESRYVTLGDIRNLVTQQIDFTVVNKASHEDVTDRILLQVLIEQEQAGRPALSREFMLQAIRTAEGYTPRVNAEHLAEIANRPEHRPAITA